MTDTGQKHVVLIVDDEPSNIKILLELLRDDYTTRVAIDGKTALEIAFSENPPDLILLDVVMPGMDGYEVCRKLKENPHTAAIPVMFISVMTTETDEKKGLETGAVDYVTKPFRPAIVKARIETHLRLRQAARELENKNAMLAARIEELEKAKSEIKTLQGFLPICAYCKKIRNDRDLWEQMESYVTKHAGTEFSHSVCPDCYEKFVKPQLSAMIEKKAAIKP